MDTTLHRATVIRPNGKPQGVKNLGWILRHWSQVEWLGFNYVHDSKGMVDGEFVAKLRDGTIYLTQYASISVFWNWAHRPVFDGVKLRVRVNYDGPVREFTIGDAEYRHINRLPYKEQLAAILGDTRKPAVPFEPEYQPDATPEFDDGMDGER